MALGGRPRQARPSGFPFVTAKQHQRQIADTCRNYGLLQSGLSL
jgi:hypothetical protein